MRLVLCLLIACSVTESAAADIFRWTDPAGRIHYGDTPPGAQAEPERLDAGQLPPLHSHPPFETAPLPVKPQRSVERGTAYRLSGQTPGASLDECIRRKRKAVTAERAARRSKAEELDNWLWKNCRSWSSELRKVEQELM